MESSMTCARTRPAPARRPPRALPAVVLAACAAAALAMAAVGFGGTTTVPVPTVVDSAISIQVPAAGSIEPGSTRPGIEGVAWDGSTVQLGSLVPGDLSTLGLTWRVMTNHPFGYQLSITNPSGTSPVLTGGSFELPDLPETPTGLSDPPAVNGFGIAVSGTPATQLYVDAQWGADGSLFRGVPAAPTSTLLATRATASDASGDPYRIDYAAGLRQDSSIEDVTYSGSLRLVAVTL